MSLVLQNVSAQLGQFTLSVDLEIDEGITVLFGPSGAGKTSLFDMVAGLRRPAAGRILLNGDLLNDKRVFVPARNRRIGYVPQDLALFPHLSVRQNLLYGFRKEADPRFSFEHIVDLLEIEPLISRGVTQLSGGEKQRVALARALLASPRFLLLDEPLGNLDLPLKSRILAYLLRIQEELRVPIFYITHDRFETQTIANSIVVIMAGAIVQRGPVQEVLARPASAEVAHLLLNEAAVCAAFRRRNA